MHILGTFARGGSHASKAELRDLGSRARLGVWRAQPQRGEPRLTEGYSASTPGTAVKIDVTSDIIRLVVEAKRLTRAPPDAVFHIAKSRLAGSREKRNGYEEDDNGCQ